ncbi:MAG: transcriptional repressor LexA [Phycisphaeraceae bacterium]|nr:transcriptional repressor LexA [Phycisphaeraceae bacterium]
MNLTPKQLHILTRIRDLRIARGYSPTMQELADELGVSKVTVFEHVEALIRKGALERKPNKARSLEISAEVTLPDEERGSRLPLVGTIAAGLPIEAVEERRYLDLEEVFSAGKSSGGGASGGTTGDTFALRVRGDSMIDAQICDGDYVIIRKQNTARQGETVVALLESGEATLKKFYKENNGMIRLQPANEKYEPIMVKNCQVLGVVVGVVRKY